MNHPLLALIDIHKQDRTVGIYSVCSAHPEVLSAAMLQAKSDGSVLLIESTSNQVDQYGGYTGMTPADFSSYVHQLARIQNFPEERVIIGGDHLGPNRWQKEKAEHAMSEAHELVRSCVKAGYSKIHLDTSMRCGDDPGETDSPLDVQTIASRAAELCLTAEKTVAEFARDYMRPVYVIGTDVPIPGGAQQELSEIHVTPRSDVEQTIEVTREAFLKLGLQDAWERVIAVVVQPGVEFSDTLIFDYEDHKASDISDFIENYLQLIYEAHSTDYQKMENLKQMVKDHFAILKVGPWLTFAYREAVFALALIEEEWLSNSKSVTLSRLRQVVDNVMIKNPKYWSTHYKGTPGQLKFARGFSLSDRIRYYWPYPTIQRALKKLLQNLSIEPIPLSLLSQYLPQQLQAVRKEELQNKPMDLILGKIMEVTGIYSAATRCKYISNPVFEDEFRKQ